MAFDEEELHDGVPNAGMDETSPLLSTTAAPSTPQIATTSPINRRRAYVIVFVLLNTVNIADLLMQLAQVRIYEAVYCQKWYLQHDPSIIGPNGVAEAACKLPKIQSQVATLAGWKETFDALPGLFLALPIGILADKYGRKTLFQVNMAAVLLRYAWITLICLYGTNVPLRLVWLGSVFNIVSGGNVVAECLFCIVISDITPRQGLANMFFYVNAMSYLDQTIGPIIYASLMRFSAWYPIWLALALQTATFLISLGMPETLAKPASTPEAADASEQVTLTEGTSKPQSVFSETLASFLDVAYVFSDWRLVVLAALYPIRLMKVALDSLLPRYASYRYQWTFAKATYLSSLQALGSAVCLMALLPATSDVFQTRLGMSAIQKSVVLARISFAIQVIGLLIEGLAGAIPVLIVGLIVTTLGVGVASALRALAGSLVEQKDNGKVFTALALAEGLSQMAAYPLVNGLYSSGIDKGGGLWLGLPFDITAAFLLICTVGLCVVKFDR